MTAGALWLRGAGKHYTDRQGHQVRALAPLDLALPAGGFTAIVGRSGCGKSTLLRMLAGLVRPSEGEVGLDGKHIGGPHDQIRYVFQDYGQSLLPWKTVEANVRFGLRHAAPGSRAGQRSVAEILELVSLGHASRRYPSELSGGMQQRVAIARAIAAGPRVLLMDEPFSAVDALSRSQLQDMLLRLWTELGLTVVLVTHDVDEAVYLADRVLVLAPSGRGVQADVHVDLGRPRDAIGTREDRRYLQLRREILGQVLDAQEEAA